MALMRLFAKIRFLILFMGFQYRVHGERSNDERWTLYSRIIGKQHSLRTVYFSFWIQLLCLQFIFEDIIALQKCNLRYFPFLFSTSHFSVSIWLHDSVWSSQIRFSRKTFVNINLCICSSGQINCPKCFIYVYIVDVLYWIDSTFNPSWPDFLHSVYDELIDEFREHFIIVNNNFNVFLHLFPFCSFESQMYQKLYRCEMRARLKLCETPIILDILMSNWLKM